MTFCINVWSFKISHRYYSLHNHVQNQSNFSPQFFARVWGYTFILIHIV